MTETKTELKRTQKALRNKYHSRKRRQKFGHLLICIVLFGFVLAMLMQSSEAQKNDSSNKPAVDAVRQIEKVAHNVKSAPKVLVKANNQGDAADGEGTEDDDDDDDDDGGGGGGEDPDVNEDEIIWREGYEGHGTDHEQLGLPHFEQIEFSPFFSRANYSRSSIYTSGAMTPVYNITNWIFDHILTNDPAVPPGYIKVHQEETMLLGDKVERNNWRDLVGYYWSLWLWVFFLLVTIIAVPFIGVCYCCLCCCRRCKQGCPPCEKHIDARNRLILGILLLLLIIGILFCIIITLVTNKMLDRGLRDTVVHVKRGSEDTCAYLDDFSSHINHLMVLNYQELQNQMSEILKNSAKHIFADFAEASQSNALNELDRIMGNMPDAKIVMKKLDKAEKDLRFYGAQLRDGLRGVKRDLTYDLGYLCSQDVCFWTLHNNIIEFLGMSPCLHYDQVPNTTIFVDAIKDIIDQKLADITKDAIDRTDTVNEIIKEKIDQIIPVMESDIDGGYEKYRSLASKVRATVDSVVSDIHENIIQSASSFDDVYDKFGEQRSIVSLAASIVLVVILIILIISLLCGVFGARPRGYRDPFCNKSTGSTCLLLAIILIFIVYSALTIIGLFYFVIGFVTYYGACAPLRYSNEIPLFRDLDNVIDINRYLPDTFGGNKNPLRMAEAIDACNSNETIFQLLRRNGILDMDQIMQADVIKPETLDLANSPALGKLHKVQFLTPEEKIKFTEARKANLSSYRGQIYRSELCTSFAPTSLTKISSDIRSNIATQINVTQYKYLYAALINEAKSLEVYQQEFVEKLLGIIQNIESYVDELDKLILIGPDYNFSSSIKRLIQLLEDAEDFFKTKGKKYLKELTLNLTSYLADEIDRYQEMVLDESNNRVGHCAPLAHLYERSVNELCNRLVNPINGYWFGLLLCMILFLPTLVVAHKLMCLYKKVEPYVPPPAVVEDGSEYLYDAYSEREQVPLANVPKRRRKGNDRRREQQEYFEEASPGAARSQRNDEAAAGTSSSTRYNDMAPIHWDHEPPRYHYPPAAPPSSEYERPPPYYYPGAADQD